MKIALKACLLSLFIFYGGKGVRLLKKQDKVPAVVEKPKQEKLQKVSAVMNSLPKKVNTQPIVEKKYIKLEVVEKKHIKVEERKTPKIVHHITEATEELKVKKSFKDPVPLLNSQNQEIDYAKEMPVKEPKLLTTQLEGTRLDLSDQLYAQNAEVTVRFAKLDHKKLLAGYFEAMLKEKKTVPLPAAQLLAKVVAKKTKKALVVSGEVQKSKPLVEKKLVRREPAVVEVVESLRQEDIIEEKISQSVVVKVKEQPKAVTPSYNPFIPSSYAAAPQHEAVVLEEKAIVAATPPPPKQVEKKMANFDFSPRPVSENSWATLKVTTQKFSFAEGIEGSFQGFEIRPDYSMEERWGDSGKGYVSIQKELDSQSGIIGAQLYGRGIMDVRVDLFLEQDIVRELSIPVFYREEFSNALVEKGFSGEGGFMFVELDSSTESIDLDVDYEGIIYFDRHLKEVDLSGDYHYMLFIGVAPGSTTVEYIRNGYENLKRVVLIEREAVYYEPNEYLAVGQDIVQVNQRNLFGSHQSDLNIREDKIVQFNSYEKPSQIGPSQYDLTIAAIPSGTRKYVELNHLSAPIYLGRWDANNIVIPSEDYIANFLEKMNIDDLSGQCLIQLNFKPHVSVESIDIEGKNGEDYIPIDRMYVGREGYFSQELGSHPTQAFLLSDQAGVINIRVRYENRREDFLNTYCASSAYIVEQL